MSNWHSGMTEAEQREHALYWCAEALRDLVAEYQADAAEHAANPGHGALPMTGGMELALTALSLLDECGRAAPAADAARP